MATTKKEGAALGAQAHGSELMEQRLIAKLSQNGVGFDPTIIITLITVLLPLIQNCFKPKPAMLRRRGFAKIRAIHGLREKSPGLSRRDAEEIVEAGYEVLDESSDEEVQGFIDECCVCN